MEERYERSNKGLILVLIILFLLFVAFMIWYKGLIRTENTSEKQNKGTEVVDQNQAVISVAEWEAMKQEVNNLRSELDQLKTKTGNNSLVETTTGNYENEHSCRHYIESV